MFRQLILVTSAAGALAPAAAFGHHSRAPYDLTQEVVIEGTVTKLDWKNPHTFLIVETKGPGGELLLQEIEVMAVSEARALGLPREAALPPEFAHTFVARESEQRPPIP